MIPGYISGISSPNSVSRTYGYDTKGRITSIMESIASIFACEREIVYFCRDFIQSVGHVTGTQERYDTETT